MNDKLSIQNSIQFKEFLDEKVVQYNNVAFISSDPIQVPHRFTKKEDIEIAAFLSAMIAWGQRPTIIRNANRMVELMEGCPADFILQFEEEDLNPFMEFVHRTFNGYDFIYFLKALRNIYTNHGGLEEVFVKGFRQEDSIYGALKFFRKVFFEKVEAGRTGKHVSDVATNSSAKRLNMFLRWMVRQDKTGVDFGLWKKIPPSALMIPLDVHTGNTARKLGLLTRRQNDWKAVEELTSVLRTFDINDPVKYDFALFGLGVFEKF
ncbi:TIGR02757 family protein [Bacteroidota bacterium]